MLLEAYTLQQLAYGTGGPPHAEMMMDLETLTDELVGLTCVEAQERQSNVHEGRHHNGTAHVVQVAGRTE